MIILLGPDESGKTTLAKSLSEYSHTPYMHFTKDSTYKDYIDPLTNLDMLYAVLDRHAICEYPYSICMNRDFKFSPKEWHNIILLTLAYNPLIILCTHKPLSAHYHKDQYLPYEKWDECINLYRDFLNTNIISYIEYDYVTPYWTPANIHMVESSMSSKFYPYWIEAWRSGFGYTGSTYPRILLVAERIGPNNIHNIPFETGPTGLMLSEMLYMTRTPLGALAITNYVKSYRRDSRGPNAHDDEYFKSELNLLHPEKVIFMGSVSKRGISICKDMGIECDTIVHLGYHNYKKTRDMRPYWEQWKKMIGLTHANT